MPRDEDDAAIYHHDRGTRRHDEEKEKTNLEMYSICHSVVLRNFDTVVQTLLLMVLRKQMEIRDLIPVSSASPHERRVEWFPPASSSHRPWDGSWSQWALSRHSRREDHTFSFAWLLGNRPALKGVRDAAPGERNVRMRKFQSIK